MLRLIYHKQFIKALEKYRGNDKVLKELKHVVNLLVTEKPIPPKYKDHELKGKMKGIRNIHLRFDDVLIYVKVDGESVTLLNIGTHNQVFKM